MTLAAGTRVGAYEILSPLGAGGMGEVWRARDTKLDREVALKVLPEVFANDPDRLARFEREAKVLASLNHPNIAHLYGLETVTTHPAAGTAAPQDSQASPEAVRGYEGGVGGNSEFGIRNSEFPATASPEASVNADAIEEDNSKLKTQN
jgi:serine/threonine protein kinase